MICFDIYWIVVILIKFWKISYIYIFEEIL